MADRILFLPGASSARQFWRPVSDRIETPDDHILLGWPGFSGTPRYPSIRKLSDLVEVVAPHLDRSVVLIGQSMGGVVAILSALAHPVNVERLVLTATSGGMDTSRFGASDWRPEYRRRNPGSPEWFTRDRTDLSHQLPRLNIPTLLIFGDADPVAPVGFGRHLEAVLQDARLVVIPGGDHDMATKKTDAVLEAILPFLTE